MKVKIKKVRKNAIVPKYQTKGSAGFDVHAVLEETHACYFKYLEGDSVYTVEPHSQCIVATGLSFVIPEGYELQIRPRSGLAAKKCITITNSPGTLDSDYRDELFVILYNLGNEILFVKEGDRIAQCVLNKIEQAELEEVENFNEEDMASDRGGGLGSTGI